MELEDLRKKILSCERCPLRRFATRPVPGEGSKNASLMLVGEAPGREEDLLGRPFVGRAGKLLRRVILENLGIKDVYITNVVKCRPPRNRTPKWEEMITCGVYLDEEIRIVRPKTIVALGRVASAYLLGKKDVKIGRIRGKILYTNRTGIRIPMIPTYHPAAALRNPTLIDLIKEDIKKAYEISRSHDLEI